VKTACLFRNQATSKFSKSHDLTAHGRTVTKVPETRPYHDFSGAARPVHLSGGKIVTAMETRRSR